MTDSETDIPVAEGKAVEPNIPQDAKASEKGRAQTVGTQLSSGRSKGYAVRSSVCSTTFTAAAGECHLLAQSLTLRRFGQSKRSGEPFPPWILSRGKATS